VGAPDVGHNDGVYPFRRRTAALFYGLGFAAMTFTFVGINLLKWGLHRY